jgi:hypothetical protein
VLPPQDDSDFWRQWNSQVAQQWNAYDQGQEAPTPYLGQFQQGYDYNRRLAALPLKDRLDLQYKESQNQLGLAQEQRLLSGQQFNQGIDRERLRMDMEAARRKAAGDPFADAATRVRAFEQGFGFNPLEALALAEQSPDWQKTGKISFPGSWQLDAMGRPTQLPGKTFPYDPQTHAYFSQLRSQMIPGYNTPMGQQGQQGLPASTFQPVSQPAAAPASDDRAKFEALKAKKRAEEEAAKAATYKHFEKIAPYIPQYSYELGGP